MNVQLSKRAVDRRHAPSSSALALASVLALGLAPLAACERHAMSEPDTAPPPMAAPAATLDGRPSAPVYPAPPAPAPQTMTPMDTPSAAPYAVPPRGIVAMEPIPNPPEASPAAFGHRRPHHPRAFTGHAIVHARRHHYTGTAPAKVPVPHAVAHAATPKASTAAPATASGHLAKGHAKTAAPKPAAAAAVRATHVAALQNFLATVVQKGAVLAQPEAVSTDQAGTVTLTLPADFAATAHTEAGRQGLADAAASMNLSARLTGDGYTILPQDAQSQPLISGQPTKFSWTVSATPGVKGPLSAHVNAALLGGGGDQLDLGTVATPAKGVDLGVKITGAALLIMALLGVVALAANRRRPTSTTEVRQRRPLDMNDDTRRP